MKRGDAHPLRTARCQHNLTIEGLAEKAKVGASTVWRAEHNYPINAESRRRLCAYFNMTPQALGLLQHIGSYATVEQPPLTECVFTGASSSDDGEELPVTQPLEDIGQISTQPDQPESEFAANSLDALLDAHWTLDAVLDSLRIALQGIQSLPVRLQQTLLLGMLSRMDTLVLPDGRRISATERHQVKEALGASIAQCWQFFHTASPTQVFLVGQGLLHLLEQTRVFLYPADYQSFYAAITNLIGSASFFQGFYDVALQTHKRAFRAAQEGADLWNETQSLNWQAIAANSSNRPAEAVQYIEAALHLLEGQEEQDYQRLRAHLCADWAYNASILGEQTVARARLDDSVRLLDNLGPNEEFDLARWHQLVGDCMLLNRQYTPAISHLERSLARLPQQWVSRRILTLLPLARAYAYQQERDMSIETAEQAASAIQSIGSVMLTQRFIEYLHMLVEVFPRDKIVHRFVAGSLHQIAQKN
ncbi:hypothetical protein KSF_080820 [Reticulibacter mediterranei]|uniref:HTH cro/C1-type domain-containing protein n=1 Tax=Reticulibacter mediterranei TaxID=2778369 RepID=A0A8J3N4H4_9CHLR|nr:helix-turn-helix transcriptional regulator [Reticulibacter mediterranei]GHO98034.1 hypothetical protein KSF_080820 [Reticulibacter mediterranei]